MVSIDVRTRYQGDVEVDIFNESGSVSIVHDDVIFREDETWTDDAGSHKSQVTGLKSRTSPVATLRVD